MKVELTPDMVREFLQGVELGSLSRDELIHALEAWAFPIDTKDRDYELRSYLEMVMGG